MLGKKNVVNNFKKRIRRAHEIKRESGCIGRKGVKDRMTKAKYKLNQYWERGENS